MNEEYRTRLTEMIATAPLDNAVDVIDTLLLDHFLTRLRQVQDLKE